MPLMELDNRVCAGVYMLYVIATPIGNLQDTSFHLKEILSTGVLDVLLCEDTRHTRKLISALSIENPPRLEALHAHNEEKRLFWVEEQWKQGKILGMVSDAGTPAISDPGRWVVERAHHCEIPVRVVSGPSSITAGLSVSGFPVSPFLFLGFPPRKRGARQSWLIKASQLECTLVLLESGKRFPALLADLKELMEDRELCICRELTKKFEEVRRGTIHSFEPEVLRGECVVVVGPGKAIKREESHAEGLKGIAQQLAQQWGISNRDAYNRLITIKN
jgi:16S rRNA (cytidine1402-2'-O)-methyltransferase